MESDGIQSVDALLAETFLARQGRGQEVAVNSGRDGTAVIRASADALFPGMKVSLTRDINHSRPGADIGIDFTDPGVAARAARVLGIPGTLNALVFLRDIQEKPREDPFIRERLLWSSREPSNGLLDYKTRLPPNADPQQIITRLNAGLADVLYKKVPDPRVEASLRATGFRPIRNETVDGEGDFVYQHQRFPLTLNMYTTNMGTWRSVLLVDDFALRERMSAQGVALSVSVEGTTRAAEHLGVIDAAVEGFADRNLSME